LKKSLIKNKKEEKMMRVLKMVLDQIAFAIQDDIIKEEEAMRVVGYVWQRLGMVIPNFKPEAGTLYLKRQLEKLEKRMASK